MESSLRPLGRIIFLSRWLQAPLYIGLIVAQVVYVYRFLVELWHLTRGRRSGPCGPRIRSVHGDGPRDNRHAHRAGT